MITPFFSSDNSLLFYSKYLYLICFLISLYISFKAFMYNALIFLETMYTVCKKRIRISWKKDRQICLHKSYKFKNRFYTENSKSKQNKQW